MSRRLTLAGNPCDCCNVQINSNAKKAVREPLLAPERSGEGSAAGEGGEIPNVGTQLTKEEALEASEFLSALFAKLSDPKPDEYARLMARLDGVVDPAKPPITNSPAAVYRTGRTLYYGSKPTMKELSGALGIPAYATTRMIEWWVKNGLAERLPNPNDRRVVRIGLTEDGRRFHEAAEGFSCNVIEGMLDCLTDAERDTFIELLAKVASNLKAHDEKQSRCGS